MSLKASDERISSRVARDVETPIGSVFVTYDPRSREVVASFHGDIPELVRHHVEVIDGIPELHVAIGPRVPHVGDEITQDGSSFEVSGVRQAEDGEIQVKDDTGTWRKWKEK